MDRTRVLELLDAWRAAERPLDDVAPDDPARPALAQRAAAARDAYTSAFEALAAAESGDSLMAEFTLG